MYFSFGSLYFTKFYETGRFIDIVLFVNIGKTLLKRKLKAGKKSYFIKKSLQYTILKL